MDHSVKFSVAFCSSELVFLPSTTVYAKPGQFQFQRLLVGGLEHEFYFPIYWE